MAGPYELPHFNLLCFVWRDGHIPNTHLPDLSDIPCQLYVFPRFVIDQHESDEGYYVPPIILRFPLGAFSPKFEDVYLIKGRAFMYYKAFWAERMHTGFPNEYFIVQCGQTDKFAGVPRSIDQWDTMTSP